MEACPDTSMSKGKAFQVLPVKLQLFTKGKQSWWRVGDGIWREQNSDEAAVEITCQACIDCLEAGGVALAGRQLGFKASVKVSHT